MLRVERPILLRRLAFKLNQGEAFAVFSYSIDPDGTDAVLQVGFDDRGDVVSVDDGQ